MASFLAESAYMYFNAALAVRAVAIIFVIQNAVIRAGSFGWRWPCVSKSLRARRKWWQWHRRAESRLLQEGWPGWGRGRGCCEFWAIVGVVTPRPYSRWGTKLAFPCAVKAKA